MEVKNNLAYVTTQRIFRWDVWFGRDDVHFTTTTSKNIDRIKEVHMMEKDLLKIPN